MQKQKLNRVFSYKGTNLPDPNPTCTVEQVMKHYTNQYPELVNYTVESTDIDDKKGEMKYAITVSIGTKG